MLLIIATTCSFLHTYVVELRFYSQILKGHYKYFQSSILYGAKTLSICNYFIVI